MRLAMRCVGSCASSYLRTDRRPEFQKMIADATLKPSPYDAVIVHSQSRFFRDSLEFGLYERRLNKAGVKLFSITQQTSDDSSGQMRKIFSDFVRSGRERLLADGQHLAGTGAEAQGKAGVDLGGDGRYAARQGNSVAKVLVRSLRLAVPCLPCCSTAKTASRSDTCAC